VKKNLFFPYLKPLTFVFMLMPQTDTYSFSFTGASLLPAESLRLAELLYEYGPEEMERLRMEQDLLNKGNVNTGKRQARELLKRLTVLPESLQTYLLDADQQGQRYVLFLGTCLAYRFIYDFVLEVLRPKALVFDFALLDSDYDRFVRGKRQAHPELDELTDSSERKIKQRTLTMLEQAGLTQATNLGLQILNPILPYQLQQRIVREEPAWLRLFLLPDSAIKNLMNL
jgi:hypothetical protein